MSKSLEALERLRNTLLAEGYWQDILQDVSIIEKELKALEIIKDKRVNCFDVIDSVDYKHYLVLMEEYHKTWRLTKKEYDLLKEVLGDE